MFGRPTAPQMASESFRSFLLDFTYGVTNCGLISDVVTKFRNRLRPKVRSVRGFHADEARWQVCKKRCNCTATKRPAKDRLPMAIDAMIFALMTKGGEHDDPPIAA
jgi:hypothetical protein